MANLRHLGMLKLGIKTWNRWRKENVDVKPDLSSANLSGAQLSGAQLSGAYLKEAQLNGANLIGAKLFNAD